MTWFLLLVSFFLVTLAVGGFVYHLWWMIIALVTRAQKEELSLSPETRFAILIPAHNEEAILQATLDSCRVIDYPADQVSIVVIADNCSDATAEIATNNGVRCLERSDPTRRGKGYALAWAFSQVLQSDVDAVVVLDADCEIDANSLRMLDARMARGQHVLQLNYVAANLCDSPISFLLAVANKLENDFYYAPKSRLGGAVLLRGTGMVFTVEILRRFPWESFSIVEDTDYSLGLLENSVRIHFVPESRVVSAFPSEHKSLGVQRSRWIGGALALCFAQGVVLLAKGVFGAKLRVADTGLTLLTLNRAIIICELLLAWLAAFCLVRYMPVTATGLLVALLTTSLGYVVYAFVGLLSVDRRSISRKYILSLPITTAAYILIALKSIASAKSTEWVKTPRGKDV